MKTNAAKLFAFKGVILLASLMFCVNAQAQRPYRSAWLTDGDVFSVDVDNDYVYIGGSFSTVSANSGSGVKLTTSSDQYNSCYPFVTGTVLASAPDGSGGWYIGGTFTSVGGVTRNNIAHLLSTGALDVTWNPNANSSVYSIAVSGSSVYAGGSFTTIGGQTRNRIAKLNNTNGNADGSWNANADATVYSIVVTGTDIYAGGQFTTIGGQSRNYIAKLNNTNGNADATWDASADSDVWAVAVTGTDIYAGGRFTSIGGQSRNRIAKLNNTNGNADATWNANANDEVLALCIDGADVYAGGIFTTIGGQSRNYIAKLNSTNGNADATWNANAGSIVYSLASGGSYVYAGGAFTTIGGQSRNRIAKLNNTNGNADASWNPNASAIVYSVAISGSDVFAGGAFTGINQVTRNNIARFYRSTGVVDYNWNPNANNIVRTVAVSGSDIYTGGDFTSVGGQTRNYIAKLNNTTGAADGTWDANASNIVYTILINGSNIYTGGQFLTIGGQSLSNVARLNTTNGNADATWAPNPNNGVVTIAITGSDIYVGGFFSSAGGQSRNYIAKLNNTNGNADASWNPNANEVVRTLAVSGSDIYAGGAFTSIGGQTRNYIAKLNNTNGNADGTWDANSSSFVYSICIDGSDVYAAGIYLTIGGQTRNRIAKLNNTNGNADASWNPNAGFFLRKVLVYGSDVYLAGAFTTMGGYPAVGFAEVRTTINTASWTGASSTSWAAPCNWAPDQPLLTTDALTIPSGTTYTADLGTNSYTAKSLTVNSGASMNVGTGTLTITEGLVNNGTINSNGGTVTLGGSSAQQISGTGTIKNLTLSNSAGASISSGLTSITGTLTVSAGTLTTGGLLTLKSSATGTARVAQLVGSISGNVSVERYIPAKSARKWTYIACPVSGNTIRDGWQDDVFITGAGSGGTICGSGGTQYNSNGFDVTVYSTPSMYVYNVTPVSGTRWVSVANTTATNLVPGTGYRMNIRGSRGASDANCQAQLNTGVPAAPIATTVSATGTLMQGNVNVPIKGKTSYNAVSGSGNAYTLIGNPYASEVSLQSLYASNSGLISSSYWFYTPLNAYGTYSTYNATTLQALDFPSGYTNGNVSDVIVASGQAFFVERSGNADVNLVFQESHKTTTETSGNNFYKTQSVINDKIKIAYTSTTDAELRNSIYINYINDPAASATNITTFDSYSFNTGNSFYLASQKSGNNLAIQSRAAFNGNDTVVLNIKGDAGVYKFNFSEYDQFIAATEIKLLDNYLGTVTNIRSQPEYTFSITGNAATQGSDRFKIVFRSAILPVAGIELSAKQQQEGVKLDWYVLAEHNMNGYTVERSADAKNFNAIAKAAAVNNNNSTAQYTITDMKPLPGTGYYRIKGESNQGEIYYSKIVKVQQGRSVALHIYPNPVKEQLNIVLSAPVNNDHSLRIINAYGQQVMQFSNIKPSAGVIRIPVQALAPGMYSVQLLGSGEVITERFVKQ